MHQVSGLRFDEDDGRSKQDFALDSPHRRRAVLCGVLFSVGIGFCLLLLNWPTDQVPVVKMEFGSFPQSPYPYTIIDSPQFRHAGWPATYLYRVHSGAASYDQRPTLPTNSPYTTYFSPWWLLLNVVFAAVVMACVGGFTWVRHRHLSHVAESSRIRWRYDALIASICLIAPLCLWAASNHTAKQHLEIAKRWAKLGRCDLVAEVPGWMANRLPRSFARSFMRIRSVHIIRPTKQTFDELARVPSLHQVALYQSDVGDFDLRFLRSSPSLVDLTIGYCRLGAGAIQEIAGQEQLQRLSLRGCRVTNDELDLLDQLSHLEFVDLTQTDLALSQFNHPGWSKTVCRLNLPRPGSGTSDRLRIADWPRLVDLAITRPEAELNDSTLSLELHDCPRLSSLSLDRWQKHSLSASNLPMLTKIYEPSGDLTFSDYDYEDEDDLSAMPGMSRWQHLDLSDLPRFDQLTCQATDLRSIRLSGVPRLREVSIGDGIFDQLRPQKSTQKSTQNRPDLPSFWAEAIRHVPALRRVYISDLRLTRDDLGLICSLPHLKELHCAQTNLTNDDLFVLEQNQSFEIVNLGGCVVEQSQFDRLIKLPELKFLTADLSKIRRVSVTDNTQLQGMVTQPYQNLQTLSLDTLPRLISGVVIQGGVEKLCLKSVPSIQELIIEGPWPADYEIDGLDGLLRFAGGGSNIDDRLVELLLKCPQLDQLTLAYPHVSRSMLRRFGELNTLTSLDLPGCDVDDEIVTSWRELSRLRRVCLDDTRIGSGTIRWLADQGSLRSLSLNFLDLTGPAGRELEAINQLSDLSLVHTRISQETVISILKHQAIDAIDLTGMPVSDALLAAIGTSTSLRYCVLNETGIDRDQVNRLLADCPFLHLEVAGMSNDDLHATTIHVGHRIHNPDSSNNPRHYQGYQHRSMITSQVSRQDSEPFKTSSVLVHRPFSSELFRQPTRL